MFVYVARFERREGLCKIGVAKEVRSRLAQLEVVHGPLKSFEQFKIGRGYVRMEKFVHERFRERRATLPKCDGYTEFFQDDVMAEAAQVLSAMSIALTEEEAKALAREQDALSPAQRKAKLALANARESYAMCEKDLAVAKAAVQHEWRRAKNLLIRLVEGRKAYEYELSDAYAAGYVGGSPFFSMCGALELGFDRDAVMLAAVEKLKSKGRYSTCNRIALGYKLWNMGPFGTGAHKRMEDAKKNVKTFEDRLKYLKKRKEKFEAAIPVAS